MSELNTIGLKHGTDKNSNYHDYLKVYESYFQPFRYDPDPFGIYLFELGWGGYEFEDRGGESARTWYEYFPQAKIVYLDLYNKKNAMNGRMDFFQGSQTDKNLLKTIIKRGDEYSKRIVIDDASHNNQLSIESFRIIFPLLKSGDLYFIEDLETSYYEGDEYQGSSKPGVGYTTMNYFSRLTHQLNWQHMKDEYRNEYADKLEWIHFYKELIAIKKK